MKSKRRLAYRRGRDTKWQVWWPMAVQLVGTLLAVTGLYYGLTQRQAVQAALFDERTQNLKEQLNSLQSNMRGLETYIIQLHRNERREQ